MAAQAKSPTTVEAHSSSHHCPHRRKRNLNISSIVVMATVATAVTSSRAASAFQSWVRSNGKLMNRSAIRYHQNPFTAVPSSHMFSSVAFSTTASTDEIIPFSSVMSAQPLALKLSGSRFSICTLMMAVDDDENQTDSEDADVKTIESTWNVPGLKKEAQRLTLRCHKKIGKASTRLENAKVKVEELKTDPDATLEQLEQCPDIGALEAELEYLRTRLSKLTELEEMLTSITKKKSVLPEDMALLAIELDVKDEPPKRQQQVKKKNKGPKTQAPRKPYRKYYSKNKTEIRVGKQAADNDELSLSPEHRDSADWWMHASGCPGSHVVIRCHDEQLNEEVVKDAAALAARQSKCAGANIKVSLTRCRNVSKPRGAKAGLVQLNGDIRTVSVNMKESEGRLQRLDETVLIN